MKAGWLLFAGMVTLVVMLGGCLDGEDAPPDDAPDEAPPGAAGPARAGLVKTDTSTLGLNWTPVPVQEPPELYPLPFLQDPWVQVQVEAAGSCDRPRFDPAALDMFTDHLVAEFEALELRAASMAVSDECGVLYEGSWGSWGVNPNRPASTHDDAVPTDALFRIGSMSKPLGAAALQHLVARSELTWDTRVFCPLGQPSTPSLPCVFTFDETKGGLYNFFELTQITLRDVQGHVSGFAREDADGDPVDLNPLVIEHQVSQDLGIDGDRDLVARDFVRWVLDEDLPGMRGQRVYSNFGHFLVGAAIEEHTGMEYHDYLCQNVLEPVGIACGDIVVAHSRPAEWDPREVGHDACGPKAPSPWAADFGTPLCLDKGGLMLKIAETTGGMASTASAQAEFYRWYWYPWPGSPDGGLPRPDYWTSPEDAPASSSGERQVGQGVAIDGGGGAGGSRGGDGRTDGDGRSESNWADSYGHDGGLQDAMSQARQCTVGLNVVKLGSRTLQTPPGDEAWWAPTPEVCAVAEAFVDAPPHVSSIWVADTVPSFTGYRTPAGEYQDLFDAEDAAGRRLVDVNGYVLGDQTVYASTWSHDDGTVAWRGQHGATAGEMQDLVDDWTEDGFRPVKVSAFRDAADVVRYASVWEEDAGGLNWSIDLDLGPGEWSDLLTTGPREDPVRVVSVDGFEDDGQGRLAVIWEDAEVDAVDDVQAFDALSNEEYQDLFDDLTGDGWRLSDTDPYRVGGELRHAAVFEQAWGPPWRAFHGMGHYGYGLRFDGLVADGFRPVTVAAG